MLLFKLCGLLLILAAATLAGFFKSTALKKRVDKLSSICVSLSKLGDLIRSGAGELKTLFEMSFDKNILCPESGDYKIDPEYLKAEDNKLLTAFFCEVGMADSRTEYSRICVYKALLEKQLNEAESEYSNRAKLYRSLGFFTGLSICIFLI
ncbi:MAG: stage III sporulation protein AB [Acutalibacteraceae bacterium]